MGSNDELLVYLAPDCMRVLNGVLAISNVHI